MRLNKYLAGCGVASRRAADKLIQAGATEVNGRLVTDPAYAVTDRDEVVYDGQKISLVTKTIVLIFNKPKGVITSTRDERDRKTVFDFIDLKDRLFPVGRLDRDTTGLLLLTNDGELANRLAHPRWHIPRIYRVEIDNQLTAREIQRMRKGLFIGGGEFGRAEVVEQHSVKSRTTVILRLYRGKKREIRRLFFHLDRKLFSLERTAFGPLELEDLPRGKWRYLSPEEIKLLKGKLNGYKG